MQANQQGFCEEWPSLPSAEFKTRNWDTFLKTLDKKLLKLHYCIGCIGCIGFIGCIVNIQHVFVLVTAVASVTLEAWRFWF